LLIRHSKYSEKYTLTDCFFGDFAHWEGSKFDHRSTSLYIACE